MNELIRVMVLLAGTSAGALSPAPCCKPVAVTILSVDSAVTAPRADEWFGSDKVPHFWMSYATTAFTFAAVSALGGDRDVALRSGLGSGAAAGLGKEIHDWRRGWSFSLRDLTVDALGVAAAYFLLREVR